MASNSTLEQQIRDAGAASQDPYFRQGVAFADDNRYLPLQAIIEFLDIRSVADCERHISTVRRLVVAAVRAGDGRQALQEEYSRNSSAYSDPTTLYSWNDLPPPLEPLPLSRVVTPSPAAPEDSGRPWLEAKAALTGTPGEELACYYTVGSTTLTPAEVTRVFEALAINTWQDFVQNFDFLRELIDLFNQWREAWGDGHESALKDALITHLARNGEFTTRDFPPVQSSAKLPAFAAAPAEGAAPVATPDTVLPAFLAQHANKNGTLPERVAWVLNETPLKTGVVYLTKAQAVEILSAFGVTKFEDFSEPYDASATIAQAINAILNSIHHYTKPESTVNILRIRLPHRFGPPRAAATAVPLPPMPPPLPSAPSGAPAAAAPAATGGQANVITDAFRTPQRRGDTQPEVHPDAPATPIFDPPVVYAEPGQSEFAYDVCIDDKTKSLQITYATTAGARGSLTNIKKGTGTQTPRGLVIGLTWQPRSRQIPLPFAITIRASNAPKDKRGLLSAPATLRVERKRVVPPPAPAPAPIPAPRNILTDSSPLDEAFDPNASTSGMASEEIRTRLRTEAFVGGSGPKPMPPLRPASPPGASPGHAGATIGDEPAADGAFASEQTAPENLNLAALSKKLASDRLTTPVMPAAPKSAGPIPPRYLTTPVEEWEFGGTGADSWDTSSSPAVPTRASLEMRTLQVELTPPPQPAPTAPAASDDSHPAIDLDHDDHADAIERVESSDDLSAPAEAAAPLPITAEAVSKRLESVTHKPRPQEETIEIEPGATKITFRVEFFGIGATESTRWRLRYPSLAPKYPLVRDLPKSPAIMEFTETLPDPANRPETFTIEVSACNPAGTWTEPAIITVTTKDPSAAPGGGEATPKAAAAPAPAAAPRAGAPEAAKGRPAWLTEHVVKPGPSGNPEGKLAWWFSESGITTGEAEPMFTAAEVVEIFAARNIRDWHDFEYHSRDLRALVDAYLASMSFWQHKRLLKLRMIADFKVGVKKSQYRPETSPPPPPEASIAPETPQSEALQAAAGAASGARGAARAVLAAPPIAGPTREPVLIRAELDDDTPAAPAPQASGSGQLDPKPGVAVYIQGSILEGEGHPRKITPGHDGGPHAAAMIRQRLEAALPPRKSAAESQPAAPAPKSYGRAPDADAPPPLPSTPGPRPSAPPKQGGNRTRGSGTTE